MSCGKNISLFGTTVTQEATVYCMPVICLLFCALRCSKEQKQAAVWTKPLCYKGSKANSQIAHVLQHREEREVFAKAVRLRII